MSRLRKIPSARLVNLAENLLVRGIDCRGVIQKPICAFLRFVLGGSHKDARPKGRRCHERAQVRHTPAHEHPLRAAMRPANSLPDLRPLEAWLDGRIVSESIRPLLTIQPARSGRPAPSGERTRRSRRGSMSQSEVASQRPEPGRRTLRDCDCPSLRLA